MKFFSLTIPLVVLAMAVACEGAAPLEEVDNKIQLPGNEIMKEASYSISFDASDIQTKVIYSDNIGSSLTSSEPFTMKWKPGDEVVAIRWPKDLQTAPTDWFTLVAKESKDGDSVKILFDCSNATFPASNPLQQGERFVLVHGDFVLGDANDASSLSFPVSRYDDFPYSIIHHGGNRVGDKIEFDGQDGTLDCLSRHQFMVADAYINIVNDVDNYQNPSEKGVVQLTNTPVEKGVNSTDPINLNAVNSIIRLQAFLPDSYFTGDRAGEKIQAISITTTDHSKVFYRYFRMHPNQIETESTTVPGWVSGEENVTWKNYWMTDENSISERNQYLRIDLSEGFDPKVTNDTQSKLISKPYQSKGTDGRLVTLYFAIPSKSLSNKDVTVSIYTNSHAYMRKEPIKIKNDYLKPGNVIPLTFNFKEENVDHNRAITDAKLGITFAPGLVYADKKPDGTWTHDVYHNQGEYAGMSRQSLDFGEYFVFGSIDPTECYHLEKGVEGAKGNISYYNSPNKKDVAAMVSLDKYNNYPFSMLTKAEAERLFEMVIHEGNYCIGYYFYTVNSKESRTYHDLTTNGAKARIAAKVPNDDESKNVYYTGTYGIWIGTRTQPSFDDQDLYVFLPNSKQLDNKSSYAAYGFTMRKTNGELYPEGYTLEDKGYLYFPGKGWEDAEATLKFSTNVFEESPNSSDGGFCYRLQFWYNSGRGFDTSATNLKDMQVTFGRPVRPIIF